MEVREAVIRAALGSRGWIGRRAPRAVALGVLAGALALPAAAWGGQRGVAGNPADAAREEPPRIEVHEALAALESSDPEERAQAAAALAARAEHGDAEAMAALLPLLHAPDAKVRYHAAWGLGRVGEPAVPALLREFRRLHDDDARARVAGVLGGIGLAARAAIPDLRGALRDPDSHTAGQAAYALGNLRAREALPDLVDAYATSRTLRNQRKISRGIRRIGSDQAARESKQALVRSVRRDLEAPATTLRAAALPYTERLYHAARDDADYDFPTREELRPLLPGLIRALDDPGPTHALSAMRALALAGHSAPEAAPTLEAWLHDPSTTHQARKALQAIGTPEALRMLQRHEAQQALEKRVRTEYSVEDHQGRTSLLPFQVEGTPRDGVRMAARFLYDGRQPRRPERVVVSFESSSETARLEGVSRVEWFADAASISMTDLDRSWSRSKIGVIERVSGTLALQDFLALARARTLRARLGPVELAVAQGDRAALRHFASKIPGATPASPGE
jgi:HEAT repeat protein